MLKATLIAACLALAAPVWAGDVPSSTDTASVKRALSAKRNMTCVRSTGTRIRLKSDQCAASPGRVYTQKDLQRSGAQTLEQALRQLDPAAF